LYLISAASSSNIKNNAFAAAEAYGASAFTLSDEGMVRKFLEVKNATGLIDSILPNKIYALIYISNRFCIFAYSLTLLSDLLKFISKT
jgi:hypothetical protein